MTVVKTIGTGTGLNVTPDYTLIDSWDSYLNGLGTFTEDQVGRVLWASSANELTRLGTLSGSTPSTFRIYLEAGDADGNAGGSFRDNVNKTTNALRYNSSNGACIHTTTAFDGLFATDPNITIRYLQIKKTISQDETVTAAVDFAHGSNTGRVLDSCIVEYRTGNGNNGAAIVILAGADLTNCLLLFPTGDSVQGVQMTGAGGNASMTNCVIAKTSANDDEGGTGLYFPSNHTNVVKNCAFFGWAFDTNGAGALTESYCATDLSSTTSGLAGTGSQYSLTGTTEWESVTSGSEDFRLKSGSTKCKELGTSTGAPSTDIIGQSRS
jgi:hypothetical protein